MSNHGLFGTQRARSPRLEPRPLQPQSSVVTAPQLTASVNDYSPVGWGTCDVLRLSSSASWNITGFRVALDGRPRLLWNVGSFAIVLLNASTSSRVDNRISMQMDVTLGTNSTCVIQYDVTSQSWRVVSQGLPGFIGSQNTAAPNATVNASRLLVVATTTNADAVFQPKGAGALLAQLPDSTITGGNKRGNRAVDLIMVRNAATEVASGNYSVAFGRSSTASGSGSVVAGGLAVTASNSYSAALGGRNNTASGSYSVVSGYLNTASGSRSSVPGGDSATTRALYGMAAIASGRFGTQGDAQRGQYILRGLTTDATAKVLTADQSTAAATNQVVLPNNSAYCFTARIVSHRTDVVSGLTHRAVWVIEGVVVRDANAASVVVSSAVNTITNTPGWTIAAAADTTNGCVKFTFTGVAAQTVRTVAVVTTTEVTS